MNNNFILIICCKGIGIFDIKSKELIQYIEEYYSPLNTIIGLNSDNRIYISYISNDQNNNKNNYNYNSLFFINNISYFYN